MMKLTRSKDFVPVVRGSEKYYGGHQEWLKHEGLSKFFRDRACVVTAFTNTFFYLFRKGPVDFDYYNKFSYCSIPTDSCNAFGIFTDLLTQRILYSLLYMFQKTV